MTEPGPEPGPEPGYYPPPEPPTQQFLPPPVAPPPPPRDNRLWWWVGGGIGVLAVAGLVVGLVLGTGGSDPATTAAPGPSVAPPSGSSAPATPGRHHGKTGASAGVRVGKGVDALQGPVTAVGDGKLTITPDGLPAVTVTTNSDTKVVGGGATAVTDLKPGEQVIVLVKAGTATQVRVRPAGSGHSGGPSGSTQPTG